MKKFLSLLFILCSSVTNANNQASYSEIKIGVENISYSETLNNLAGLGRLSQAIDITNPTIRQTSYSDINKHWGFYIKTASTISTDISTEK
jgi:hypothetical protein